MQTIKPTFGIRTLAILLLFVASIFFLYGCNSSAGNGGGYQMPTLSLPVITISTMPVTTHQEFSASLQGTRDIEIRPQVEDVYKRQY